MSYVTKPYNSNSTTEILDAVASAVYFRLAFCSNHFQAVQCSCSGWPTGNRNNLSNRQACCLAQQLLRFTALPLCSFFLHSSLSDSCVLQNIWNLWGESRSKYRFILARNVSSSSLLYAGLITFDCALNPLSDRQQNGTECCRRPRPGRRADVNPLL